MTASYKDGTGNAPETSNVTSEGPPAYREAVGTVGD
jgi:hypothetical protein